ncbi:porin [Cupriavidus pauculus]|jgi:predicted porin|uniref:porin n=1 Tax=Cupriavidus pauculus TaxID=82633 RepID=UPI0007865745|nr:porin [Cupriavidus pauculus]MBY4732340.1 porin [Cupriavidus pauculus]
MSQPLRHSIPHLALAGAAMLAAHGVQAQSSVTLYGVADVGVEFLTHADANNRSLTRMTSGNLSGSRWGIRGTEDLGGGLQALFVLENGFDIDAGTAAQGGRLFGRQAFTGISSQYGRVTLGRQNNILYDILINYDAMAVSPRYSIFTMDAMTAGRYDNTAKYVGKFGGFTVTGLYSFARGTSLSGGAVAGEVPGDPKSDRAISGGVEYNVGKAGMTVIYDMQQGTSGIAGQNTSQKDQRLAVAGSYSFASAKLFAGYRWFNGNIGATATVPSRRADLFWIGAGYQLTPALSLSAAGYLLNDRRGNGDAWSASLLLDYAFSKRTDVYAQMAYIRNDDGARIGLNGAATSIGPAGTNQFGTVVGIRHKF